VWAEPPDKTIDVKADDPEMEKAKATARTRLPEFWEKFKERKSGETDFALKVRIEDKHGVEFFWATDLVRRNGKLFGTINNDPNTVQSVKFGQEIEIPDKAIADWMYLREDKIYGNFTLRPLLKKMSKRQADALRTQLAEP
jgi:uncharacterized protein YegJ (DUF2314 family)